MEETSSESSHVLGNEHSHDNLAPNNPTTDEVDVEKSSAGSPAAEESTHSVVDWDGSSDPHNPMNWSIGRKWAIIILVSTVTFNMYVLRSSQLFMHP
jgi:MFS transporter, DHA1 family, multidrug resistance protein